MAVTVAVTSAAVFLLSKPLSAYQLGESYAKNLGVNVKGLRTAMVLLSSILSACIVAFAGPISFDSQRKAFSFEDILFHSS